MTANPPANISDLFKEGIRKLFPNARPLEPPDKTLVSDHTFFFSEGEGTFWVEMTNFCFSRQHLADYLAKARSIQAVISSPLTGLLAAPDFEPGVQDLLGLLRIPLKFLRYEPTLSLQDVTPRAVDKIPSRHTPTASSFMRNRLSREELREFIQFEIDASDYRVPLGKN